MLAANHDVPWSAPRQPVTVVHAEDKPVSQPSVTTSAKLVVGAILILATFGSNELRSSLNELRSSLKENTEQAGALAAAVNRLELSIQKDTASVRAEFKAADAALSERITKLETEFAAIPVPTPRRRGR